MSQEYAHRRGATRRTGREVLARYWPLLVPVVWCVVIQALMRPDAVAAWREVPFTLKWLVYDESDLTALAVRGANQAMGRPPGDPEAPAWDDAADLTRKLDAPQPAYRPRYYLEYPVPALALFRLAYGIQPGPGPALPPSVADGHHVAVGQHVPRSEAEQRIWTPLGYAVRFYVVVMAAALVALMVVVGRGYEPGDRWGGPVWLAALPGAVFFSLNRFDILPALTTALGFYCLGRGMRGWSGAWLAAGVVLKVYPVLFVPVVLRFLGVRASLRWVAGFVVTAAAALAASVLWIGWEGTLAPLKLQLDRPLESDTWVLYGRLLPMELGEGKLGRQLILALAVLAAVATRPADLAGVLRRCGVVLVVFVSLAVFWSPQWFLWFLPLVIPLARTRRELVGVAAALDLLSYFTFPVLFWIIRRYFIQSVFENVGEVAVYLRAALYLTLAGWLVWDEVLARRQRPVPRFPADSGPLLEAFRRAAAATGKPRELVWNSVEPAGEPVLVEDTVARTLVALVPVVVQFEPVPGSEMEEVPQARDPRPVTALFTHERGEWRTVGRGVFNLSPAQVVERGGRYVVVSPGPRS